MEPCGTTAAISTARPTASALAQESMRSALRARSNLAWALASSSGRKQVCPQWSRSLPCLQAAVGGRLQLIRELHGMHDGAERAAVRVVIFPRGNAKHIEKLSMRSQCRDQPVGFPPARRRIVLQVNRTGAAPTQRF